MDCIMKVILVLLYLKCTFIAPSLAPDVKDPSCYDNCKCCIGEACETGLNGWTNVCIKGCIDGHRGHGLCQYTNCKSCGEQTDSRTCTACYDGFYLGTNDDCTLECPSNCKSCTSSTRCTECKEGFYNISTLCNSACPRNCHTCMSEDKCSDCKNGYYNGYEYDNQLNPERDNCTYECRDTCTKCQSYNNCSECLNGKYGLTCQDDCSVGCENKTCLIDSGNCDCSMNFTGDKCSECVDGKYGQYCNQICPKYCERNICNKTSGYCVYGCLTDAIIGEIGNTCKVGKYGELCPKMCLKTNKNSSYERDKNLHPKDDQRKDSYDDGDMKIPVTTTVLGCLLALSVCINFVVVFLFIKNKKHASRRDRTRQSQEVFYENVHGSSSVNATRTRQHRSLLETTFPSAGSITEAETNTAPGINTNVYEVVCIDDDTDNNTEHTYQQIQDRGDSGAANWIDTN